jgi:23S rRNA pseudouridine1911/1915/1917 synthase
VTTVVEHSQTSESAVRSTGTTIRTLTADRGDAGRRLDLVLRRHLAGVAGATRTRVQAWIEAGLVMVNRRLVCRAACRVAPGDVLVVNLGERQRRTIAPEEIALDVLYEDDDLLVVNKPAGMVVHPTYAHAAHTMMNALLWRARDWPGGQRPTLVGRLDKFTSGLVVVARTRAVHAALQRALTSGASEKHYLAVVYGRVNTRTGTINLPLGRDARDRRRMVVSATGAPSETRFERLARTPLRSAGLSLLRCRLMTGRMHQIRVHLAARGWPIVGDAKYGRAMSPAVGDREIAAALQGFTRQALHAWCVEFTHPVTRARVSVEAPVPHDLAELIKYVDQSVRGVHLQVD